MEELWANLQFGRPLYLWLLLLLPIVWLRFSGRRLVVLFWRSIIIILAILALADPQSVKRQSAATEEQRLFAFDLSQSIPASTHRWMAQSAQGSLAPQGSDRVYVF